MAGNRGKLINIMVDSIAREFWITRTLGKQRYLLIALAALLVLLPAFGLSRASTMLMSGLLTVVVVAGPLSLVHSPIGFYTSLLLGCVMVGERWINPQGNIEWLSVLGDAATVLFFLSLSVLIFREYLLRNRQVTSETLVAAINGYLCIGIMYAFGYFYALDVNPNAFAGNLLVEPSFDICVYLSFVTMTTLGYGDITPQTHFAAVLTWTQAVLGQLYLALTIARIVGTMASKEST